MNLIKKENFDIRTACESDLIEVMEMYKELEKLCKKGLETTQKEIKKRIAGGEVFENIIIQEKPKRKKMTNTLGFLKSMSDLLDRDTLFAFTTPSVTKLKEAYAEKYVEKYSTDDKKVTKKEGAEKFKELQDLFSESNGVSETLKINKQDKIKQVN